MLHQSLDICALGILDDPLLGASLERDAENPLHPTELFRVLRSQMPREGMDGGEARITRADAIAPLLFQVR